MTTWKSNYCNCSYDFDDTNGKIIQIRTQCKTHTDKPGDNNETSQAVTYNITQRQALNLQYPAALNASTGKIEPPKALFAAISSVYLTQ